MSTYVAAFKGYIADVPQIWFKRCDGTVFHYDEITSASVNPNVAFTEVNAGWSMYPVAYLPGQSSLEMQFTSGQFNADLFAMANAKKFAADENYMVPMTDILDVDASAHTVTLTQTPAEDTIFIAGMTKGSVAAEGVYSVAGNVITFDTGVTGKVEVNYEVNQGSAMSIEIDNKSAAIGEAVFKWPVYGTGDDCTEKAIKGYVMMKVYKCRCTTMPGFDTSYKSAATNSVTFSAMDAKRPDGSIYNLAYVDAA